MISEVSKKPSPDVLSLFGRLRSATVGETVTYEELTSLVGRDVQGRFRHLLNAARNKCLRENQIAFRTINNVGVVRLDDPGMVTHGFHHISKARANIKKGTRVFRCVQDLGSLPEDKRRAYLAGVSICGALELATSQKTISGLESKIEHRQNPLPTAHVFQAMVAG